MERGKQTRRVPYTVNKLNVIRSALAGYHGDVSIVREMAQNADDARSPWLEFRFFTDRLVVRNASVFTSKNFDAILSIASGSKRDEASMTGTWGAGFLAVYHLTDHPELHSAGEHIVFDPCLNELDATVSHVKDGTEFHLPWRTTRTEIAKEIEAEPWDAERIARLRAAVAVEIYRVLPFLRQLRRIAVYDGDAGEPAYSVARSMTAERVLDNGTRQERWEISGWDGQDERSYHWVVYRGELDRGFASNSSTAKTREIAFAVAPPTSWFGRSMPGLLYNFLPTPVETGFTFHIQGDFFPDANRQGILTDAGEKGDWNRKVIEGIAELFVANLETLREEAAQPRDFYQLLPVSCAAHCAFLSPITKTFRESATEFGLILCTDGRWTRPGDVRFAGEALRTIAQDYMPGIAPRSEPVGPLPTTVRAFVETLGGRRLDYADVLAYLRSVIPGGTRLEESDAILNSREKLDRLLGYIEGRIANTTGSARDSLIEALVDTPIVLDTDGNLQEYGSDGPYLASAMMRAILPEDFYWLVDAELEMQHRPVFAGLEPLNTDDVIRALTEIAPECSDKQMAQAHPAVGGWNKLTAILDYLVANQEHITADVSGLPICPDDDGVIHTIADAPWIADDEARELLAGAGVRFMARLALAETRHVEWLERAGVDRLTPSRMIDVLERITQVAGQRDGTTGWLKDRDRLRGIYRYFYRHENHLDVDDRRRLRALPFVLTQGGRLHAIDDATMPLTLPPASADEAVDIAHILNLDNLVSDDVLDLETRPFFEVTLGLRPLTRGDYIQRYVLEHYQAVVDHEARLALLDYVRCHSTLAYGQPGLLERMMKAPLVRCSDDVYRAASDVYFPSAALDAVFPLGYAVPHAMYDVQAETAVGSNTWADFFRLLHMREQPGADDIVRAVQRTLEEHSAPDVAAVAHMQTIYTLLNRRWDAYQAHSGILAPLQVLAWLPSQREDRWYRPDEVFSANLGPLIASQAPILRFVQARTEFAQFLGLNLSPRMSDVVQHLLWLSRQKGGDPPANAIYTELGRASLHELAPLRGEPVIYDHAHTRYWRGDHVFIGSDAAVDFGRRRCYLAADDVRDWLALFTRLGAHTGSATEADYRAVLAEIADEAGCEPIDAADEYIVHRAYGALARMLDPSADEQPAWVAAMRSQRVVLCTDGRMRTPGEVFLDDRPGLLEHFRDDAVHLPKDIERRERSVLLAIGVRRLSDVVRRELDTITDPKTRDPDRTARLRILGTPLRRIVDTYAHESDTCWNDPEIFSAVAVYSAPEIYV
ncbi:MAG: hypothetical protein DCC58_18640, partial [Chloroflexi bacterium]